ncbi:MAG: alpha/beta hydrolase family protein, partial [Phycisphaerae bacterium]
YAPDLGWRISAPPVRCAQWGNVERVVAGGSIHHAFAQGEDIRIVAGNRRLALPDAALLRRGEVKVRTPGDRSEITYFRCRADEHVPHQEAAWREATVLIGPSEVVPWNALLEPPHQVSVSAEFFDTLYHSGAGADLTPWDTLDAIRRYHRDATVGSALRGDDFGNVTMFPAAVFGMNRLNHCPPIFEEYYRSGDARLRETALQWCANYHDLSIWWGTGRPGEFGGTRYNNASRHANVHTNDAAFMWRSNTAVTFCTKGYDSFFYAYEETGDPRMATCLRWQIEYAKHAVHVDRGECRNIGDVLDFLRLYRFTGRGEYLDEALRLFRELRTRLSTGDLFDQGGKPIANDPPFIEDDAAGLKIGYAKPYIIGYALQGLPDLLGYAPDEPKLHDVVRAVAGFLAGSQDPVGGWRYPHPLSATVAVAQGMEHANQLVNAARALEARGESIETLLDAIERVLQSRILVWQKSGTFFSGLGGWEQAAGLLTGGRRLGDLYRRPGDRPRERDYTEGAVSTGSAPPEGIVYFSHVLNFYLAHRPAERLFHANPQLQNVLNRVPAEATTRPTSSPSTRYARYGMADKLPTFAAAQNGRLTFPLAYDPAGGMSFARWRAAARKTLLDRLMTPPPRAAFDPAVLATEDRGSHEARKLVFNISADCRVPAYLLVPKGVGPFPAIVALHDHGAHFSIGKEKVVRPFDERPEVLADAQDWAAKYYGGRFIGDELAARGYVVFAADALFWGDRGRREGVEYSAQQELAANLMQLGMTWVGVITWDDIRSAEFLAAQREVDPARIGAIGLSMGGHRTWMLCAASDRVAVGAAICWMATTGSLMVPGNNQTRGQSAFSILIPGISNDLDIPDIASIACPKPMLIYNGEQDQLFPIPGVQDAYARMRRVWDAQAAGERLETKLWPVPHVFTREMQEQAFAWLDRYLGGTRCGGGGR